jgi:hypothetical protein
MLHELLIAEAHPDGLSLSRHQRALAEAQATFPGLYVRPAPAALFVQDAPIRRVTDVVIVPVATWCSPHLDPVDLDRAVDDQTRALVIDDADPTRVAQVVREALTRVQRLLPGRNHHAQTALFDRILVAHRKMHDRSKPLVAADFDHALDCWRWTVRLDPDASAAVQIAALFHDVERLVSEADVRVEQHASDYLAFKMAHAATGARMVADVLTHVGAPVSLITRAADLVATHERPDADPEKSLLNEADALSFFSLNACGFIRYYGRAHTVKKVRYTLDRLGPRGRRLLAGVRHRSDLAAILHEVESGTARAASEVVERTIGAQEAG